MLDKVVNDQVDEFDLIARRRPSRKTMPECIFSPFTIQSHQGADK